MEERRNSKNNKKSDDEEEEDDYFKQIENRRQKLEDKRNSKYIKNINNTISHSKFANKLSGTVTIKVYILNTGKSIRLKCGYGDSIKDLKLMKGSFFLWRELILVGGENSARYQFL